jgi:hypothetical protein
VLHKHSWNHLLRGAVASVAMLLFLSLCRGEALPIAEGSWTLVILPDTQVYSRAYPQHFEAQTKWIVDHADSHNIKYVLHEGDITDNNVPDQWDNAAQAMQVLDGKVPYALATGNHDYGPHGNAADRTTMFNEEKYFGPGSPYSKLKSIGGLFEKGSTENSYHTFEAGGRKWLVLALEWAPRDAVVEWANKVAAEHSDYSTILLTHAYMYYDDTRYDWATKGNDQTWNPHSYGVAKIPGETVNDGEQLWQKLVSRHPNFRFTFNGHVLVDGTGRLTSKGEHGNKVHQLLANYQFKEEGGRGDMRLMEFLGDGKTVKVRTYSPVLDRYDRAADQEFELQY